MMLFAWMEHLARDAAVPHTVAIALIAFAPTPAELEESEAIIAAFEMPANRGRGAIAFRGRMIERLHVDEARRTLDMASAIGALQA